MVVIILILLSLGAGAFMMLTDTRKNDNFKALEQRSNAALAEREARAAAGGDGPTAGGNAD
jgi:type II secretory pathway pseudopilin PulG